MFLETMLSHDHENRAAVPLAIGLSIVLVGLTVTLAVLGRRRYATVLVAALLIAQGWPAQRKSSAPADIDLAEALTFVVRSRRWVRKLLVAALCVLFFWLLVPYLFLSGYLIDLARRRRAGERDLPRWNRPWIKLPGAESS